MQCMALSVYMHIHLRGEKYSIFMEFLGDAYFRIGHI